MKYFIFSVLTLLVFASIESCTTQRHATSVEQDKDHACVTHMIIQIGVDSTDADVISVREQLEPCFTRECPIPCPEGKTGGCKVMVNVIVKKWSDLSADDRQNFHHVTMVPDDGLPSRAQIGKLNDASASGTWRRNAYPRTYCHETLHLLGLEDQYCSRLFNAVDSTIVNELNCVPPPDPQGGTCCTPTAADPRCSEPCDGHENDLMADLRPELTCTNILDVLKAGGFNKCPDECCSTYTYHRPDNWNYYIGPNYMRFGDKSVKYSTIGLTGEYNNMISPKIGLTIDAGYHTYSKSETGYKQISNFFTIDAGITYFPTKVLSSKPNMLFSTHAMLGITDWVQKYKITNGNTTSTSTLSINALLGVSFDWNVNSQLSIRLPQVDFMPTFFAKTIQPNLRIGAGIVLRKRK